MLKRLAKVEGGHLRSLKFHARDVLSGFEHLEVQSIIILEKKRSAKGSDKRNKNVLFRVL